MKDVSELVKTTIVGGFVVILPIVLIVILVAKAVAGLRVALDPVTSNLPGGPIVETVTAVGMMVALCFVTGALARTAPGERAWQGIEHGVLRRIPGYDLVRVLSRRVLGQEEGMTFAPALVVFDDSIAPAFVVEEHSDGRYTVFVPAAPTPAVGAIHIMARERVHILAVPFSRAVRCITQWGVGSAELLREMKAG